MKQVQQFEEKIAEFYGSKYAVATDCCTHAIELCLRYTTPKWLTVPAHTYLSVPMTLNKLGYKYSMTNEMWEDYYYIGNTQIIDGAVYWKKKGYENHTFLCLSFQHKKHLSLGRGGMILTNDEQAAKDLKKMSYDGRLPDVLWAEQNVDMLGYHYYMTPETAQLGLDKLQTAIDTEPRRWSYKDYPDLRNMKVFSGK